MTLGDDGPVGINERDALFAPLAGFPVIVLAVSGGPDSTALLHLAHAWSQDNARPPASIVAVTVDHGLRPESAAEADAVADQARRLGIEHRTVRWAGPAPDTGLQAAARMARYRLLSEAAQQKAAAIGGPAVIVTAHTADDQAETLIMRLARGSGVDGLASIPALSDAPTGAPLGSDTPCPVVRPLLGVPRHRLLATLAAGAIPFVEDPSNSDRRFERVRIREALRVLEALGVTREALQRSVSRLQSAREVLEQAADQLEVRSVTSIGSIVYDIDRPTLSLAPRETGIRLLRRLLARAGGAAPLPELGAVETAFARLIGPSDTPAFTLGGCIVDIAHGNPGGARVRIYREPDRKGGLECIELAPGTVARWDERFRVAISKSHPGSVEIGPLGDDWLSLVAEFPGLARLGLPRAAARGIPAFRQAGKVHAMPLLAELLARIGDLDAARRLAGPIEVNPDHTTVSSIVLSPLQRRATERR